MVIMIFNMLNKQTIENELWAKEMTVQYLEILRVTWRLWKRDKNSLAKVVFDDFYHLYLKIKRG